MRRGRAVTTWTQLDGDSLGYIVEAGDLARQIAGMLRLAAELVPDDSEVALAAGLGPTDQIVEGRLSDLGRRGQVTLGSVFGRRVEHSGSRCLLTRKGSQVQTLSRPPTRC
jgi:hypothetical protein